MDLRIFGGIVGVVCLLILIGYLIFYIIGRHISSLWLFAAATCLILMIVLISMIKKFQKEISFDQY